MPYCGLSALKALKSRSTLLVLDPWLTMQRFLRRTFGLEYKEAAVDLAHLPPELHVLSLKLITSTVLVC